MVAATLTLLIIPVANAGPGENTVQRAGTLAGELDPFPHVLPPPPRALRPGETPPAPYSCLSVDLGSPDNQCKVSLDGHRSVIPGDGSAIAPGFSGSDTILVSDSLTVTLSCSTERGAFGQAILVTNSASHRIGLQWVDSHRLTVGIPIEARFSRPVEHVDNLGEGIDIRYVPTGAAGTPAPPPVADCHELPGAIALATPLHAEQVLTPPRHGEDWSTVLLPREQCLLMREPADLGGPRPQPSVTFHQFAKTGLPFWTRDLVFVVRPPGSPTGVRAQLKFADSAPVALIPNGSVLRGWRATGQTAERVLRTLRAGHSVQLDLLGDELSREQMFIDSENIAAAAETFEACRTTQLAAQR